jgi:FkbM family methyltransferase
MNIKTFLIAFYKAFISPSKPKKSYSQYAEDLIIQSYFSRKLKKGRYVDVGCHHPRRGSNTYGLYRKGWSGILIDLEKTKVLANQLSRRRDKVVLAAVNDTEEWMEIFSDKAYSTNTTIKKNQDSTKEQSIGHIKTQTLTNILNEQNFQKKFELLSIDVEGVDLQVLKGIDLKCYQPQIICIENWDSKDGVSAILNSEIHQYLNNQSYELVAFSGLSTIYQRSID